MARATDKESLTVRKADDIGFSEWKSAIAKLKEVDAAPKDKKGIMTTKSLAKEINRTESNARRILTAMEEKGLCKFVGYDYFLDRTGRRQRRRAFELVEPEQVVTKCGKAKGKTSKLNGIGRKMSKPREKREK